MGGWSSLAAREAESLISYAAREAETLMTPEADRAFERGVLARAVLERCLAERIEFKTATQRARTTQFQAKVPKPTPEPST